MEQEMDRAQRVHRAMDLLIHNSRMHHRLIEKAFGDSGVHRSQRKVLLYLSESSEAHSQKEIAERFDVSPACVTRLLKGLVADDYVLRSDDESDLRRNSVRISEKGLQLVSDTRRTFDAFDQSIFRDFDRKELETLCELLEHMQANLRACESMDDVKGCGLN